jgi:hypothetical protein
VPAPRRPSTRPAGHLIGDTAARITDLGAGYYSTPNHRRQSRSRIRDIERLNPGMKVTLTPTDSAAMAA